MPAGLAREDGPQCFGLLLIGAFVHIDGHLPVAVEHTFGRTDDHRRVQAAQTQLIALSIGDVPADHHIAMILRCFAQEDAIAAHVARARLEIVAGHTEGHAPPPRSAAGRLGAHMGPVNRCWPCTSVRLTTALMSRWPPPQAWI